MEIFCENSTFQLWTCFTENPILDAWQGSKYTSANVFDTEAAEVLENFPKLTGKHLHESLFFNNIARPSLQLC